MGRVLRLVREGGALQPDGAVAILEQLRAGAYVPPLVAEVLAFQQTDDDQNFNFVRFTPEGLARLAASFPSRVFLRDHDQFNVTSIAGRIIACSLESEAGAQVIRMSLEVVKPWAQEGILDGTIASFSIGWHALDRREPYCSIDGASMFSLDCPHMPGQRLETKDGVRIVEMIYDNVEGIEVSAVAVPAVAEAVLEEVRATLAAHRAELDPESAAHRVREALAHQKENQMKSIATVLGLAETSNEATIAGAVEKLKTEHATLAASNAQTTAALEKAQTKLAAVEAEATAAKLEALVDGAYRDGKIAGEKGKNEVEKSVRELAALSFAGAEAFVKAMPKVVPVGAQVSQEARSGRQGGGARVLSAEQRAVNKQLKISDEEFLKRNPPADEA